MSNARGARYFKPIQSQSQINLSISGVGELLDGDGAAPWWQDALVEQAFDRRLLGGLFLLGGAATLPACEPDRYQVAARSDQLETRALLVQRSLGWNVDEPTRGLSIPGACATDVDGSLEWRAAMTELAGSLAPAQSRLMPYYVPTLFQALAEPSATTLRQAMRPASTPATERAYEKGRSLLSLFVDAGAAGDHSDGAEAAHGASARIPDDTAIIVDVRGPEAVAFAAGLAERFDPVFTFDNWPHPDGVVPAHETLAAALFYRPLFERTRASRGHGAPPVVVLDASRLLPYGDDPGRFDNRYLAQLPGSADLLRLGVRHVLYVTAVGGEIESDDLNEDFVDFDRAGIDVKQLALADFVPVNPAPEGPPGADPRFIAQGEAPQEKWGKPEESEDEPDPQAAADASLFPGLAFYFGGSISAHASFWDRYRWYGSRGHAAEPPSSSHGWTYCPHPRRSGMRYMAVGRGGSFGRFHGGMGGG